MREMGIYLAGRAEGSTAARERSFTWPGSANMSFRVSGGYPVFFAVFHWLCFFVIAEK